MSTRATNLEAAAILRRIIDALPKAPAHVVAYLTGAAAALEAAARRGRK